MAREPARATNASGIEKADIAVARSLAPLKDHPVTRVLGALSDLADQPPLVILNSATLAAGLIAGEPRLARAGARMLAAHLLATAIKHAIKRRIDRTRPYVLVEDGEYAMEPGQGHDSDVTSFPSGHTAGAVAVAQAFARELPDHATPAIVAAAAAALMQIPRSKHYPTDIAAGAVIGVVAELLVGGVAGPALDLIEGVAVRRPRRRRDVPAAIG